MNFITEFVKGQKGGNKGLPMGEGLANLSHIINGVQRGRYYAIGAAPKVGKSTLVDYGFVIEPYLYAIQNNIELEIIYFSFELDRVSKEFDYITYFIYKFYGIEYIKLEDGVTKQGKTFIPFSPNYLRGRILDDNGNIIKVKDSIITIIKRVYEEYIVPLFGRYDINGNVLQKGVMTFIEDKDNPTGLYNYLKNHAAKEGTFYKSNIETNARISHYVPNNPNKYTIVVTDHVRKLHTERGYMMKQTIDKYSDYCTELRNLCGYTFVNIVHTNRDVVSIDRIKSSKDLLFPNSDDIKDSSNLGEDCDYLITMFNPNDEKYRLKEHFGIKIKDNNNNELYPNLRTLHLVESRHCENPLHFKVEMVGNLKCFKQIEI